MKINKIHYKIFLGLVFINIIILITMSVVVRVLYADSLKRNEINSHIQSAIQTREQFDFIMGIITSTARVIGSRPQILATLNSSEPPQADVIDFAITTYLRSLQEVQPLLGNISIVGPEGQFVSSSGALRHAHFERLYRHYESFFNAGAYRDFFVDTYTTDFFPLSVPRDILTSVWPIYDMRNERLIGQIYLGLNSSLFREMFILSPTTTNEKIMILDPQGNIIFHHPAFLPFCSVLAEYPQLITTDAAAIEGNVFGTASIIASDTSRVVGWRIVRIIDIEHVLGDTQQAQFIFNIVFIFSIITSFVFSIFMSHILTKPIKLLFEACKRIESGDMSFRVNIHSSDEVGQLGRTFNMVMDRMHENLEWELIEQKRHNELKLEVLRAQINPHFLYNTLDSIKFLANLQEIHNIALMSSSLINLLKYNLSSSTLATLGEELESINNYMKIQKFRYGDVFDFKTEIAAETEHCAISRFVLQPLVENCFIHGFDNVINDARICIRSRLEGKNLCLEVINNGKEISEENLSKLNQGEKLTSPSNGIGVYNVQERIRLQFGEQATLVFSSGGEEGTVARLHFPVQENNCVS